MRLVAISDTHLFQSDLGTLPEGDVLIFAGDLLRGGSLDELRTVADWWKSLEYPHKVFVAGNHDCCFVDHPEQSLEILGDGFHYLQDSEVSISGVRIWGSPWQPEYNSWEFNLPRGKALADKWSLIPDGIDVLITHGPPKGIGDQCGMERRDGCADLLAAVCRVRPGLHLFGHIHQDGGFWQQGETYFANVTTWESTRMPTILDYDKSTKTVAPIRIPPAFKKRECVQSGK